jgi:prepilin-type N-terminal cleavage/methylation domain-containing protein
MKDRSRNSRPKGYSLIEVLIAMAVFSVGILAFGQLQGHLARANLDARIRTLASNIAEEEVEMQKRFTKLTATEAGEFAYEDVTSGSKSVTLNQIQFTIDQTVTDYYWDESSSQFTQTAPPGILFSDYKLVQVDVTWASLEFVQGGVSSGQLDSGSIGVSTVISSRVTATNQLALLDELAINSLCVPLVSCPAASP